ncbi:MauE/DoxX family redox-associated membrane protein [Jannaschia rubra]|uniref:Methylamine utilization protein MauE n=1 Tax=Jannaschia rubra TaxID=282197 RepID=A0A0M6XTW1_9RHOB|nr:MauE/DoxX family redox-associated membrane protein [Jannaschia rubra]CTQ34530.1 glutaredoxin-family domain protein [Jannaschia rubra]
MATTTTDLSAGPARDALGGQARQAVIHRMFMPEHVCPSGLKALDLLERHGFAVDDHPLRTRAETDAFKAEHGVKTTPQVWIDGERIGGHDDLRRHLGLAVHDPKALTYKPVIAIFGMAAALALAVAWGMATSMGGGPSSLITAHTLQLFLGFATALLSLQKLRDVEGFANGFLGYDLLAQRVPRYAYVYPWAEALVGLLMVAGALLWLWAPIALVIGGIGAVSVFKAVYLDRRDLKCACVGGQSNVPLGFVSLTENLTMIGMAVWMVLWAM